MFANSHNRTIREQLRVEVSAMRQRVSCLLPGLAIVQVGGREDSNVYIRMKIRAAADIGIHAEHVHFPNTITQTELLQEVRIKD